MAAITAALVKELRETSGAGMVDCKNALVAADGNIEKAIEILREKGLSAAAKKAGRIATEGLVYTYISEDNKTGVIVEVNSETDFVAKNQEFKTFVHDVAVQASNSENEDIEQFFNEKWQLDENITVKEALSQKIAIIGENLSIRRFVKFVKEQEGALISYIHGGGRVGVILELSCETTGDALVEAGKNVCMQIAAMSPKFVNRNDVPGDFIEKETEILTQQAINEGLDKGKPQAVFEKIIVGKVNKGLKEICLLDQEYVKDGSLTVSSYLAAVSKEIGNPITLKRFVRFETGEGLEKKQENFADEVNKAMGK